MTEIVILSDIHMREGYTESIVKTLQSICDRLRSVHDPDHVFVLGDLIEDTTDPDTDRKHVQRVASILEAGPAPVTYALGNHDVATLNRKSLKTLLAQERFYGSVDVNGTPIVYLDSSVDDGWARGALGRNQLRWVREEIPSESLVLVHHPVGDFSLDANGWFREYPERAYLWDRKELLSIIETEALCTISGHIHQTDYTEFYGLSHASVNAVSKERPDEPVTGTYAIVTLDDDLALTTYVEDRELQTFNLG